MNYSLLRFFPPNKQSQLLTSLLWMDQEEEIFLRSGFTASVVSRRIIVGPTLILRLDGAHLILRLTAHVVSAVRKKKFRKEWVYAPYLGHSWVMGPIKNFLSVYLSWQDHKQKIKSMDFLYLACDHHYLSSKPFSGCLDPRKWAEVRSEEVPFLTSDIYSNTKKRKWENTFSFLFFSFTQLFPHFLGATINFVIM